MWSWLPAIQSAACLGLRACNQCPPATALHCRLPPLPPLPTGPTCPTCSIYPPAVTSSTVPQMDR